MAFNVQKQIRDNTQELQDFLKDLKDWEQTVKQKDKKLKNQLQQKDTDLPPVRGFTQKLQDSAISSKSQQQPPSQQVLSTASTRKNYNDEGKMTATSNASKHTYDYYRDKWDKFDVDAALETVDNEERGTSFVNGDKPSNTLDTKRSDLSIGAGSGSSHSMGVPTVATSFKASADAASEKEQGNDYFKEKKFVQAIECYSRSIALQPTAVAYANRAMAFIKIRRFEDAEFDCTEAIGLDDRYTKAYSRRGTARKELKRYLDAIEDFEFALRLEPQNKELQKQYQEAKELFLKQGGVKPSEEKMELMIKEVDKKGVKGQESSTLFNSATPMDIDIRKNLQHRSIPEAKKKVLDDKQKHDKVTKESNGITPAASRAAASAMSAVARNMVAPKTSYEFETLWRGFHSDRSSQIRLLKIMDPLTIPKLFKESLSAGLLLDIMLALGSFFPDDAGLAIQYLDNLTKVGRFKMTVMLLTPKDKAALRQLWDSVFMGKQEVEEYFEHLKELRKQFCV